MTSQRECHSPTHLGTVRTQVELYPLSLANLVRGSTSNTRVFLDLIPQDDFLSILVRLLWDLGIGLSL